MQIVFFMFLVMCNGDTIKIRKHPKHGTQCVIQYPINRNPAQSLQENAITVFGPRLYNSLPKYLRDIESVKTEKFKFVLVKFLELICPKCPTMSPHQKATASSTSSLNWGLKELSPQELGIKYETLPWSSRSCFEATQTIHWNGKSQEWDPFCQILNHFHLMIFFFGYIFK